MNDKSLFLITTVVIFFLSTRSVGSLSQLVHTCFSLYLTVNVWKGWVRGRGLGAGGGGVSPLAPGGLF